MYRQKKIRGFTLIEVMVSVGIFAIVITIGISSLLILSNTYRESQKSRQAFDTMAFVLETVTREIRMGSDWRCGGTAISCSSAVNTVSFDEYSTSGSPRRISYSLENGVLVQRTGSNSAPMHSPNTFIIDNLRFRMYAGNGVYYPLVLIELVGHIPADEENMITMQTAVSARNLHTN